MTSTLSTSLAARRAALLVTVAVSAGLFSPSVHADGPLTIATYNSFLMFDAKDNPRTDDERFLEKEPAALEAMADVIRATGADIIGMQEVEGKPVLLRFNEHYLSDLGYTVATANTTERTFNTTLLSRHPVKRIVSYAKTGDNDRAMRWMAHRMVYYKVEVSADYIVHVFVVHLKAQNDDNSRRTRAMMTEKLVAWMTGDLGLMPERDNIVVIGDMNDTPDSPAIATILKAPGGGFVHLAGEAPNPDYTHSSGEPTREIDMILASKGMAREYIPQTARVASKPSIAVLQRASDHLPAVAAFVTTDVATYGDAEKLLSGYAPEQTAQVESLRGMESAASVMAAETERQLGEATSSSNAAMTIAEALVEARDYLARDAEPPVRVIVGIAMSDGAKISDGRTQFSFMDPTGGIIVDERGTDNFPQMPAPGDVVRIYGRIGEYRGVSQFRPVKPAEILGKAAFPLEIPLLDFAELSQNGAKYLGAKVRVMARIVDRESVRPGIKFGLAPSDANAENPDLPLHFFVPKLAFDPANLRVGQRVVLNGIVSSYGGIYQIQVLSQNDVQVLP